MTSTDINKSINCVHSSSACLFRIFLCTSVAAVWCIIATYDTKYPKNNLNNLTHTSIACNQKKKKTVNYRPVIIINFCFFCSSFLCRVQKKKKAQGKEEEIINEFYLSLCFFSRLSINSIYSTQWVHIYRRRSLLKSPPMRQMNI